MTANVSQSLQFCNHCQNEADLDFFLYQQPLIVALKKFDLHIYLYVLFYFLQGWLKISGKELPMVLWYCMWLQDDNSCPVFRSYFCSEVSRVLDVHWSKLETHYSHGRLPSQPAVMSVY